MSLATPPPLFEEPRKTSIHHKAATYAIVALVGSFVLNIMTVGAVASAGAAGRVFSMFIGLVAVSAVPAGIIALCGIKKYGKRGLLWKGLVGTLLPVLLIAAAIPAFLKVRNFSTTKAMEQAVAEITQIAPKTIDNATRLDKAQITGDRELTILYTITAYASSEIDRTVWDTEVAPNLRKNIANTGFSRLLRLGVTVKLRYTANDGVAFSELVLTRDDLPK